MKTNRHHHQPNFPAPAFSRIDPSQPLSNILEDSTMCLPLSKPYCNPPDTPQEPMEFLSRSWSISALEVAKALNRSNTCRRFEDGMEPSPLVSAPPSFASATTAQIVMDRLLLHSDISPIASRRNSYSSGPLSFMGSVHSASSPPMSPQHTDNLNTWLLLQQTAHPESGYVDHSPLSHNNSKHFCRSFSAVRTPLQRMSMKGWIKDTKEKKKKDALRIQNAQIHAAISVAGVAAAVAAIATSTAAAPSDEGQNKTSMAVASAASLVAAQCMEVAESMGAPREQLSAIVSSAVSVRRPGDVMTLTAAAATALRAVATLKSRTLKQHNNATVIPYDRGNSGLLSFNSKFGAEDSDCEFENHDILRRGGEFLKRTSKGDLHWRSVFVYIDKQFQVVVKSQRRCMGIVKSKKRVVRDILMNVPAWTGRGVVDGMEKKRYFGIRTDHGVMELECKNEADHQLWTEGISHLLLLVRRHRSL